MPNCVRWHRRLEVFPEMGLVLPCGEPKDHLLACDGDACAERSWRRDCYGVLPCQRDVIALEEHVYPYGAEDQQPGRAHPADWPCPDNVLFGSHRSALGELHQGSRK